jgi:hypothetical protein
MIAKTGQLRQHSRDIITNFTITNFFEGNVQVWSEKELIIEKSSKKPKF